MGFEAREYLSKRGLTGDLKGRARTSSRGFECIQRPPLPPFRLTGHNVENERDEQPPTFLRTISQLDYSRGYQCTFSTVSISFLAPTIFRGLGDDNAAFEGNYLTIPAVGSRAAVSAATIPRNAAT